MKNFEVHFRGVDDIQTQKFLDFHLKWGELTPLRDFRYIINSINGRKFDLITLHIL